MTRNDSWRKAASNLDVTEPSRFFSNKKERKEKPMLEVILKRFEQPDETPDV